MKDNRLSMLQKEKGQVCVSIILPTHRLAPEKGGDERTLAKAVDYVTNILNQNYPPAETNSIITNLNNLVATIDFIHPKEGLGIFVSPSLKRVVQFPFPVKEKVEVSDAFELRDLVYLYNYSREYYVLEINEKVDRLFKGIIDEIEEVQDKNFPKRHEELYEYAKPARGSSYTGEGNLKNFEKDKSILEEIRMRDFLRDTDGVVKEYIDEKTPLILVGAEKDLSFFEEVTRHQKNMIGFLKGNYTYSSNYELGKLVWPKVKSYLDEEKMSLLREFEEKIGQGQAVAGIQDVWKAATEGRGFKLLVEKDFFQPAYVGIEDNNLYLEPSKLAHNKIYDSVEDVIEIILEKDGDVIILENDLLQINGRIALLTRY
jgi:hypothetical protein